MRVVRFCFLWVMLGATLARAQSIPLLTAPFPSVSLAPGGDAMTIDLRNHIVVPNVKGTRFAVFDTVVGKFSVELRDDAAPNHVANFLAYVNAGAYANSFIHRSATFDNVAISIVQGGGYRLPLPATTIAKRAPVALEYNLPNARGTLAAARASDVNSATSEWYFNVRDNSSILGQSNGGGYTVFGSVLGAGMNVVDQMAAVQRFNAGGAFAEIPLRNFTSGDPSEANLLVINSVREATLFPTGGGASVVEFTMQNSASEVVTALLSGSTLTLTPAVPGTATITVRATDASGDKAEGTITVRVAGSAPVFTGQPKTQTIAAGSTLVLHAPATGAARYVWQRDFVDIPGATTATLVLKNVTTAQVGGYMVYASNDFGTTVSEGARIDVVTTADPGRLINLSILTPLAAGETMTMGTVLGGAGTSGAKPLLARAAGPSLAQLGVTGFLPDPTMTLISASGSPIAANNDWGGGAALSDVFTRVGAFAYVNGTSKDAAIFRPDLNPGNYTVQVGDVGSGSGTAIAELYDSSGAYSATTPRLINVSVLKQIATASSLTAGFVIGGSTSKTVLIRAVGPTLGAAPFNVGGVMADPQLKLYDGRQAVVAINDDWGGSLEIMSAAESVGAFRLSAATSKDAVLLLSLPPGNYSAQVSGVNNTGGTAIVEVYEVP